MGTIISAKEARSLHGIAVFCDVVAGPNAEAIYAERHVQGATWVNLETQLSAPYTDAKDLGRHPLPHPEDFIRTLESLGISQKSKVVLYDRTSGVMAAARMWWMLRSLGHQDVAVVDGGLNALIEAGIPTDSGEHSTERAHYHSGHRPTWQWPLIEMEAIESTVSEGAVLVDVRAAKRYAGLEEPIDPIAGHIPGAINLPLTEVLEYGHFLAPQALKEHFAGLANREVIMHCGSGVTACHSILAMVHAGYPVPTLYNGSWSQWCRNDFPRVGQ